MFRAGVLAVLLVGCVGTPEQLTETSQASSVDDYLNTSCSTAVVLGLSRQIADEVVCLLPGQLQTFNEANNIIFGGGAVLPFLDPAAIADLQAAVATAPQTDLVINSGFRTVVQQYLLYEWRQRGRCGLGAVAVPGNSNHESGRALDIDNWPTWISTLADFGWDQTVPGDDVHFDHLESPDLRGADVQAFQRLWNLNHPDDLIAEDGDYGPQTADKLGLAPAEGFAIGASCGVGDDHAVQVVSLTGPTSLLAGGYGSYSLILRNVGLLPWAAGTQVSIGAGATAQLFDPATWADSATLARLDAAVAPGDDITLSFDLQAPILTNTEAVTDTFTIDDNGVRFGSIPLTVTVVVDEESDSCSVGGGRGSSSALIVVLSVVIASRRRRR